MSLPFKAQTLIYSTWCDALAMSGRTESYPEQRLNSLATFLVQETGGVMFLLVWTSSKHHTHSDQYWPRQLSVHVSPFSSGVYACVSAHPYFSSLNICKRREAVWRGMMCAASCRLTSREWVVLLLASGEFAVQARTDKLRWSNKLHACAFGWREVALWVPLGCLRLVVDQTLETAMQGKIGSSQYLPVEWTAVLAGSLDMLWFFKATLEKSYCN